MRAPPELPVRVTEPNSPRLLEAHPPGLLAHADEPRRNAADDGVRRHVPGHHRARPDHGVVPDRHAAQYARAVADPHVVSDLDVALVYALEPDRTVRLDHSVVEVDQHHAVGDHALATDRDPPVGGDRALLAEHGLGADRHDALVAAELAAVADPRPAAELERRALADLEGAAGGDEGQPVELQAASETELPPAEPEQQPAVLRVQHALGAHEAQQGGEPAVQRRRRPTYLWRDVARRGRDRLGCALHPRRS